jgi:hypothetical protein
MRVDAATPTRSPAPLVLLSCLVMQKGFDLIPLRAWPQSIKVAVMRRFCLKVSSALAIILALLGTPLQAQFVYVAEFGDQVFGYTINPLTGALRAIAGSPFVIGEGAGARLGGGTSEWQVRLRGEFYPEYHYRLYNQSRDRGADGDQRVALRFGRLSPVHSGGSERQVRLHREFRRQ